MSFLSGLFGSKKSQASQTQAAAGLQVQTSVQGKPIPIVYGTTRVPNNLIWYGQFTATQQQSSQGGGKGGLTGGGGKGGGSGDYTYTTSFETALCEGPIVSLYNVYIDKTVTDLGAAGLSLFEGPYEQAPWSYLASVNASIANETYTIPYSAPYQIQVDQPYLIDNGVLGTPAGGTWQYVAESVLNLGPSQYTFQVGQDYIDYLFNVVETGQVVQITYYQDGVPVVNQVTIGNSGYGYAYVAFSGSGFGFADGGVVVASVNYTRVGSSPTANCYAVSGGIYTFAAANAGSVVNISYIVNNGSSQVLGYSGIAYIAAANYSLGNNPQMPNFNFEVAGFYANQISQECLGEQYVVPSAAPYQIQVRYASNFIADNGVTDSLGDVYTGTGPNPGTNQYNCNGAGVYTFSAANSGVTVNVAYTASVGPDANPAQVVADLLYNGHYGVGFPSTRVGNLLTYLYYCGATGLLISPCYNTQTQASQILADIAQGTNSNYVWSGGILNLVPYGDQTITANGYTYTAPSAPLYSLTDDDFLPNTNATGGASASVNSDPVLLTRLRKSDAYNSITLEWLDRGNAYNPAIVQAKDQASINTYGLRQDSSRQFHMFCNGNAARLSVQLQLQRQAIRNTYQFTLDQRYVLLDPMDIVAITDSYLGLNQQWVRITEITENDDGTLSFSAEEYLQGTGHAPTYSYQTSLGFSVNYNASPGNINTPVIFEPPDALGQGLTIWVAVSGVNTTFWGGCYVYLSTDGNSYKMIGTINGASRQGTLTAALPAVTPAATGQTIDSTNTLAVNISESGGQLLSGSQTDLTNLNTLCYVDGELIAYETATLTATGAYNLTTLARGAYNSTISAHNKNTQFARLDPSIFEYDYPASFIGTTIYLKFTSFNVYGGGAQNLSDVPEYAYTVQGSAYTSALPNVTGFATAYSGTVTTLIWNPVSDFRTIDYEVRTGQTWGSAKVIGRTPLLSSYILGDGTYWVAAHYTVPNGGADIYSVTPSSIIVAGSQITQNVIASYDEAATGWMGTFTGTAITSLGLQLIGAGNILADADYLNTLNILLYGGVNSSGTYQIPASHIVNIGRVAPCQVIMAMGTEVGYSLNAVNILTLVNYLTSTNILGVDLGNNTSAQPQIALSQDGVTWAAWQNWIPGNYIAKAFKAQVILTTLDPSVLAVLSDFTFTVDVPTLTQTGTNVAILSTGSPITFTNIFNGGPGGSTQPNIQITILGASPGDDYILTSVSLSGFMIQIMNSGSGVARNINYIAEGF